MADGNRFRGVLANHSYRRMLASYAASRTGDFLYNTALVVVVLQQTGSALWVSLLWVVRLLPYVLVTPFAGVLADRMDRRRLMVLTDVVRAALMVAFVVLVAADAPVWTLVALSGVAGVVATPFMSAFLASLPEVLEEDQLGSANSLITTTEQASTIAGPALAAGILLLGLDTLPFALNAATFVLSALLLWGVRLRSRSADGTDADRADEAPATVLADLREGLATIARNRVVLLAVAVTSAATLAFGMELVLLPLVSRDLLGTGEAGVGILEAAAGVGGVVGALLAVRVADTRRVLLVFGVVTIVMVVPLALFSVVREPWVAWVLMPIEGAAVGLLDVVFATVLQRTVPVRRLARVDGLITSLVVLATVVGSLLAPLLLTVLTLPQVLLVAAGISATGGALVLVRAREPLPSPTVDPDLARLLPRMSALAGATPSLRSAVGLAAARDEVPAGTVLMAEGDAAEEVLLLAAGRCTVTGLDEAGRDVPVARVEAPDVLGEIGVLQRRPRTATVTTVEPCVVWRVPGDVFAQAVAAEAEAPMALTRGIETRLARWGA